MNEVRTAVSVFSGAGGMDVGFAAAGFRTSLVAELDASACATLEANKALIGHLSESRIVPTSVRDLQLSHLAEKDLDCLFGGPPCQGFSVAGKMDPDDERSELIFDFMRLVKEVNPKTFVMENVKALAVSDRWEGVRSRFRRRAAKAGYETTLFVLKATDFGVPQARERMFFVGIRKDVGNGPALRMEMLRRLKERYKKAATLKSVIKSFGPAGSQGNPKTCTAKIVYAKSPILRKSAYAGMLFNGAGRPIPVEGASPTLPASMGGNKTPFIDEAEIFDGERSFVEEYHTALINGGKSRVGSASNRLRRLTINECAAIQTFPASYAFQGAKSSVYKQIGNAVPCELAEAVAKTLRSILEDREMALHTTHLVAAE